jgi:hypothetical protein
MKFWLLIFCLALIAGSHALFSQISGTNPIVRFHTDLGNIKKFYRLTIP